MEAQQEKRRILFVDDEASVLEGLRNMLRRMRKEWDMEFAASGGEALAAMERSPADIVVSDMRMPEMDGVQLLNEVKDRYPDTVRFILSGHSDRESILRSVGPTHQFLAKPCNTEELKRAVGRAFSLRELIGSDSVRRVVVDIKALPTMPELYAEITRALNAENSSSEDIGAIIAKDVAMSAKILQLVNSAFFGLRRDVGSVDQAVTLLGIDTVKAVVLTAGIFEEFTESEMADFDVARLYGHSVHVGNAALKAARLILEDQKMIDECMMAGMTHDIGKILLIRNHADTYRRICSIAEEEGRPLHEVEREELSISHAETGAYVLGVWGLSDAIVEAAAFHHNPSACTNTGRSVLSAVYLANALSHRTEPLSEGTDSGLDSDYVEGLGIAEKLEAIAELAAPQDAAANTNTQ